MIRATAGALGIAVLLTASAAQAAGERVATTTNPVVSTPQPAGDSVVWAEVPRPDSIVVLRKAAGEQPERLDTLESPFSAEPGERLVRHALLAASAAGWALSDVATSERTEGHGGIAITRASRSAVRGPLTPGEGAILTACDSSNFNVPGRVVMSGTAVAYEDPCDRTAIVIDDNGRQTIATPPGFVALGLAGRYLAYAPFSEGGTVGTLLYDRVLEEVVLTAGPFPGFDPAPGAGVAVQGDGTLVVAGNATAGAGTRSFAVYSPAQPFGRLLAPRPGDRSIYGLALAGDRVAYLARPEALNELRGPADTELVTGGLDGGWATAARFGEGAAVSIADPPFGFDGTHLTWATYRCRGTTIERLDPSLPATAELELFPGCGPPTLMQQRVGLVHGRLRLVVHCARRCAGRVQVSGTGQGRYTPFRSRGAREVTVEARLPLDVLARLARGRRPRVGIQLLTRSNLTLYAGEVRIGVVN